MRLHNRFRGVIELPQLSLLVFADCLFPAKQQQKEQTQEHAGDAHSPQELGQRFLVAERGRGENHICNDPQATCYLDQVSYAQS